jgi:hypothetical protein
VNTKVSTKPSTGRPSSDMASHAGSGSEFGDEEVIILVLLMMYDSYISD